LEDGLAPHELVGANARLKAMTIAGAHPGRVVVGADTVVALGERSFGKPASEAEAKAMLAALSGSWHEVHTGVCVVVDGETRSATATTRVRFRPLSAEEIERHVALGEWRDRAGGYAIQESGGGLIEALEGDRDNVIGLPVGLLAQLLPDDVQPRAGK
jgi:septum formation protein